MPKPYIRPLSVDYHDFLQKTYEEQLPYKFKEQQEDDYQQKRHIRRQSYIRVQNSQLIKPEVKNTSCKLCTFLSLQLCQTCQDNLCQKCKDSCALKFTICEKCKQNLCFDCKQVLAGNKKIKLRNYKISLKRVKDMHFKYCECEQCTQDNHKASNINLKSSININSQIK